MELETDTPDFKYITINHTPESELLTEELCEKINGAVETLPEKGRLIYRMVKEDNMSYKQVSALLDISAKTVDSHLCTALKKIRMVIEAYYSDN